MCFPICFSGMRTASRLPAQLPRPRALTPALQVGSRAPTLSAMRGSKNLPTNAHVRTGKSCEPINPASRARRVFVHAPGPAGRSPSWARATLAGGACLTPARRKHSFSRHVEAPRRAEGLWRKKLGKSLKRTGSTSAADPHRELHPRRTACRFTGAVARIGAATVLRHVRNVMADLEELGFVSPRTPPRGVSRPTRVTVSSSTRSCSCSRWRKRGREIGASSAPAATARTTSSRRPRSCSRASRSSRAS